MKKVLKLTQVKIDGNTQARAGMDQTTVSEYSELLKDGTKFPAPTVFFDGETYWMADGFHRYFSNKANGVLELEFDIREGTQRDAKFYAMGANGGRGLKWRPEDIKQICYVMFEDEEWGGMSNNAIAKHVGVSAMTIGRHRHTWEESRQESEIEFEEESVTYVKDGETKTMKTGKIGKFRERMFQEPTPRELTETELIRDKLSELEDQFKETINENERLKDAIALGQYDASDIEKEDIQQIVADLREQIRVKDIEITSLRESRDIFQNRCAELMKQVKALQAKLKKAGVE
jgi:hypothetical protein